MGFETGLSHGVCQDCKREHGVVCRGRVCQHSPKNQLGLLRISEPDLARIEYGSAVLLAPREVWRDGV